MVLAMFGRRKKKPLAETFHTSLTGMYFLLAGLVVVLIPHMFHLPAWTSLACVVLILWRMLHEHGRLALPGRWSMLLLFVLVIGGVLFSYQTIVGRQAGTALLIILLCLKLFEIKSLRDISVIVQLAFFAVVVTFLFSQTIFVAFTMLMAVMLLLSALISFHRVRSSHHTLPLRINEPVLTASKMIVYAAPLSAIIFILFPRIHAPLWGLPEDAFSARTGLSDQMSPGRISQLSESTTVAFRARFNEQIPDKATRYWRGPVLWSFDGKTWTAPGADEHYLTRPVLNNVAQAIDYTITLEPHNQRWLFALDLPSTIPGMARLNTDMQLLSNKPIHHVTRYQMNSYLHYTLPWTKQLDQADYLQVPANAAPQARQYIMQLQSQIPAQPALVQAVLRRFANGEYYYSKQPPLLFEQPIDEFLFTTKRGYCEHYASTFTVLMRLAGIPARVVTGYQGGEMNPLSDYMIVRQSDAHAWSEIYLDDKGWTRIDPTAVIPVGNIEDNTSIMRLRTNSQAAINLAEYGWFNSSLQQARFAWDMVNNGWNQWVIGYTQQKQKSLFNALGIPEITWKGLGYLLFAASSLFILGISIMLLLQQRTPVDRLDKIYQRLLLKLRPFSISKPAHEGAYAFSLRVAVRFPEHKDALMQIAELYNRIRYSSEQDVSPDTLRNCIKQLKFRSVPTQ